MPSRGAATTERQVARQESRGRLPAVLPRASAQVTAVLDAGVVSRRMLFPDNGPTRSVEEWRPPVITDKAVGQEVWARLTELDAHLAPAPRSELMSRILVLLAHYRSVPQADAVEQGIADDWAEDLATYPLSAIENAATTWRRTKKFKPQISEIIELCEAAIGSLLVERQRLRSIVDASLRAKNPLAARTDEIARQVFKKVI